MSVVDKANAECEVRSAEYLQLTPAVSFRQYPVRRASKIRRSAAQAEEEHPPAWPRPFSLHPAWQHPAARSPATCLRATETTAVEELPRPSRYFPGPTSA